MPLERRGEKNNTVTHTRNLYAVIKQGRSYRQHAHRPEAFTPLQDQANQPYINIELTTIELSYLLETIPFSLQLPYLELHLLNLCLLRRHLRCGRTVHSTTCHGRGQTLVSGHTVVIQAHTLRATAVVVVVHTLSIWGCGVRAEQPKARDGATIRHHYVLSGTNMCATLPSRFWYCTVYAVYSRSSVLARVTPLKLYPVVYNRDQAVSHSLRRLQPVKYKRKKL